MAERIRWWFGGDVGAVQQTVNHVRRNHHPQTACLRTHQVVMLAQLKCIGVCVCSGQYILFRVAAPVADGAASLGRRSTRGHQAGSQLLDLEPSTSEHNTAYISVELICVSRAVWPLVLRLSMFNIYTMVHNIIRVSKQF